MKSLMGTIGKTQLPGKYEIILVENGSIDNTYRIALKLAEEYKTIRVISLEKASYGQAFKAGILAARYDNVVQFDIDFWSIEFIKKALRHINNFDIVIGSKNMQGSNDRRTKLRKFLSKCIEIAVQYNFNVPFTDTHGLKMIRKSKVLPVIDKVECTNHFFDTELLIRCYRTGARVTEFPVDLYEIRPSRFSVFKRTVSVIREFMQLMMLKIY